MKNKIMLHIASEDYTIVSTETEDYMEKIALMVEEKINGVKKNTQLSINQAAVLAAVQMADDYLKAQTASDHIRSQITEYIQEVSDLRGELAIAKRQLANRK